MTVTRTNELDFFGVKNMPNDTNHLCHKIDTWKSTNHCSTVRQLKSIILWLIQKCLNEIEWGNDLAKNITLMIYNPLAWGDGISISLKFLFFSFATLYFDWIDSAHSTHTHRKMHCPFDWFQLSNLNNYIKHCWSPSAPDFSTNTMYSYLFPMFHSNGKTATSKMIDLF